MAGLTQTDLDVLRHYARMHNRELYWNYLAQRPGNDGYGLLALGVVRNDNAPGATASAFAAATAQRANHRVLSEREWETFGRDLLREDLMRRVAWAKTDPSKALNLPVADVQAAHDAAFDHAHVARDAWTPRLLLEGARRHGSEPEAERTWTMLLDNGNRGIDRLTSTTTRLLATYRDEIPEPLAYLGRMGTARAQAVYALSHVDPDRIGSTAMYYQHGRTGWASVTEREGGLPLIEKVSEPHLIHQLDDTRVLRLERQQLRTQFHPDDPARVRGIERSPAVLADLDTPQVRNAEVASPAGSNAGDPLAVLDRATRERLAQIEARVHALGEREATGWDPSQVGRLSLGLATMAAADPLMRRIDDVVASMATPQAPAGARLFAVHRPFGAQEPTFHVALDVQTALRVPESAGIDALARIVAGNLAIAPTEPAVQREVGAPRHPVHAL